MKKRPIVGVLPLFDEDRNSIWMLPGYLDCLQEAGALPLILPQRMDDHALGQALALCDGLLFTGGHDTNPALYGEPPHPTTVWNAARDDLEQRLFVQAYERDVPMFGICRGIQFINAVMGGTLYQDLPSQWGSGIDHHMQPPYDRPCHRVTLTPQEPLAKLLGCESLGVNSYHHQAVKQMAAGLREMARSEDGLIEAVYAPERSFLWAIQWHPEFSHRTDPPARTIVRAFVSACEKKARAKLL
ncbi:MAG: gamma-glutamyl-gamma-aminobutyrate hydrolase family protein [Eubacteriales bacterium]|nr:gamma-glutamyl-gamma-aminobutyrate hydrolase family protein [Eubacteriales bacterium]